MLKEVTLPAPQAADCGRETGIIHGRGGFIKNRAIVWLINALEKYAFVLHSRPGCTQQWTLSDWAVGFIFVISMNPIPTPVSVR